MTDQIVDAVKICIYCFPDKQYQVMKTHRYDCKTFYISVEFYVFGVGKVSSLSK